MEKIINKDYPFTIIVEDKVSKNNGKEYQAISIMHTSIRNKDAKDPKEKYETKYFNFFDDRDLLKLSSLAENTYIELKNARGADKKAVNETELDDKKIENGEPIFNEQLDDDIPF